MLMEAYLLWIHGAQSEQNLEVIYFFFRLTEAFETVRMQSLSRYAPISSAVATQCASISSTARTIRLRHFPAEVFAHEQLLELRNSLFIKCDHTYTGKVWSDCWLFKQYWNPWKWKSDVHATRSICSKRNQNGFSNQFFCFTLKPLFPGAVADASSWHFFFPIIAQAFLC